MNDPPQSVPSHSVMVARVVVVRALVVHAWVAGVALFTLLPAASPLAGQEIPGGYVPPADIEARSAWITSGGSRIHAEVFAPRDAPAGPRPTILTAHGWGGNAALLRNDAVDLVRAGYVVVNFDYRGWGESEGRLVPVAPLPGDRPEGPFAVEVREVRGIIDPWEQMED